MKGCNPGRRVLELATGLLATGESFPIVTFEPLTLDDKYRSRTLMHHSLRDAAENQTSDIAQSSAAHKDDVGIGVFRALANLIDNISRQNPRLDPYSSGSMPVHSAISTVLFNR